MYQSVSSRSVTPHTCKLLLAAVALSVLIVFLYPKFAYIASDKYHSLLGAKSKYQSYCLANYRILEGKCHWYFLNYTPSVWEKTWYDNIELFQQNVCERLSSVENLNKTILLMRRLIDLQTFGRNKTNDQENKSDELLSKMFYRQRCIDSRTNTFSDVAELSQFIEPLIGLLRDPLTVCSRLDASLVPPSLYNGAILLSKRFLLLSVSAPYHISSFPQGYHSMLHTELMLSNSNTNILPWMYNRTKITVSSAPFEKSDRKIILLDLGSSYFGPQNEDISETSTRWFYDYYKHFGLRFDRIIAFEATLLNATYAWEQLPADVVPTYTLINTGCTEKGRLNPWVTLQNLAKPHDHVVVKMDIDTFDLENVLIQQVLDDKNIYSLIDELFFEHHVSVKEMLAYWRPPPGTLRDSYILFTKLRRLGIRMHSWP